MQRRLSGFELVEEWYKSRSDNRPPEDLLGWLIQAFWSGEIQLYAPDSEATTSREVFLRGLQEVCAGSSIAFGEKYKCDELAGESEEELVYTDETRLVVPVVAGAWSTARAQQAYAALAMAPVHHYPGEFLSAFRAHEMDREEFGRLCDRRGWERPAFWFGRGQRKRAPSIDAECRHWLSTISNGPREHPKSHYARIAKDRFGTPRKRFDQAWEDIVPELWRRPGRPRKPRQG
jgi:hypothetical protein